MSSTCLVCERIFSRTIELAKDTVVVMKKEEKNTADKNRLKTKIQKKIMSETICYMVYQLRIVT